VTETEYAQIVLAAVAHVAAARLVGPSRTPARTAQQYWTDFPISGNDIALARSVEASDPAPRVGRRRVTNQSALARWLAPA